MSTSQSHVLMMSSNENPGDTQENYHYDFRHEYIFAFFINLCDFFFARKFRTGNVRGGRMMMRFGPVLHLLTVWIDQKFLV